MTATDDDWKYWKRHSRRNERRAQAHWTLIETVERIVNGTNPDHAEEASNALDDIADLIHDHKTRSTT